MSFRDLNISTCYESNEQKTQLLDNFYIPVLEQSVKYYRIAGYFSSSALSVVAEGIEGLIKNNGKMYLLISPELSTEDYQIISEHGMLTESSSVFCNFSLEGIENDNLRMLAWLLDNQKLEIKVVVGKKSSNSLFHQKVGLFFDDCENIVSFSGSINETAQAWINNIEEFKVFKSWEYGQAEYVEADLSKFLAYWKDERREYAYVFDIPESIKDKIIHIKPRDVWDLNAMWRYKKDKQIAKNTLSLFPHQERAVSLWLRTGCSLLMEMATGTGKTRTAIGCLLEILKRKEPLLIIVATPQNTLSRQWQADFNHLHISVDKEEIIDGSNHSWRKDLELIMLDLNDHMINSAVIFTTHDTASSDKFTDIISRNKFGTKIMFIGDEVHAIGSENQRKALLDEYEYRVGLSATPERMFDDNGTSVIRDYFGSKSFEFTIADALNTINPVTGRPFLNRFRYTPVFVSLTDEEKRKYKRINQQIAMLKSQEDYDEDQLQRLYDRRAEIGKNAQNKYAALENLIDHMNPEQIFDTILFVTDKQIETSFDILTSRKIKRAKITENESASRHVGRYGNTERQEIISQFVGRKLQVLVGIKCLDEGIDIPNARIAILMASSTNPREFVQRVGRVIRQAPEKPISEIYDFVVDSDDAVLLSKEARRAKLIAQNSVNYDEVRKAFESKGADFNAYQ